MKNRKLNSHLCVFDSSYDELYVYDVVYMLSIILMWEREREREREREGEFQSNMKIQSLIIHCKFIDNQKKKT